MRFFIRVLIFAFLSLIPTLGWAFQQNGPPPVDYGANRSSYIVQAVAIDGPIELDGYLREEAWNRAAPAADFIQGGRSPKPGYPSSQRTEVRFLYDTENLYVAFTCFEEDMSRIVTSGLTRDFPPNLGDEIGITLSSLNDNRSGYFFSTNPAGARRDLQLSNDGQVNQDWHGVWDLKVGMEEDRWTVELVIPFKTMRFSDSPSQEWAVNMLRTMRGHSNEQSTWAPLPIRYNLSRVSMAGTLKGLENIRQGRNFNVKPFVVAGINQVRSQDRLTSDADYDGGLDLKYGLTSQLTLDATWRTDFSQAEVDQNQVNLTRFNLFFPEKREFFLENSGIFNFGDRATGGNLLPFFSRRIGLSDSGVPIPIVGGARVSGSAGKQEVGFLAMKTKRDGLIPSNDFIVGRVKRNLLRNSFAGVIFTSRDSTVPGDYNRVYGVDSVLQFYNRLDLGGYVLKSQTPNLSGDDDARRMLVRWQDDIVTFGADYEKVGQNFKPEVGFIRRGNMSHYSGNAAYNPRVPSSNLIRDLNFRAVYDYYANVNGKIETRSDDLSFGMNFENGAVLNLSRNETFERLERTFTRYAIPPGDYKFSSYTASYNSDRSRRIGGRLSYTQGGFWNGNARTIAGDLTVKPNYHWQGDLTYSHNDISVAAGDFPTTLVGLKLLYAFNNRAFLNSFVQYETASRQMTTNIRFSLMHRPLSDLFIVLTERRDMRAGRIIDRGLIFKLTNLFQF